MLDHFSKQVFLRDFVDKGGSAERCYRFFSVFSSEDKVVQEIDAEITLYIRVSNASTKRWHPTKKIDVMYALSHIKRQRKFF